jgi:hypothetical protein
MKGMLRRPLLGTALVLLATTVVGCYIKVDAETPVIWEGTPETLSGSYVAGKAIRVESDNGSVSLVAGSSATAISAAFQPFTMRGGSEEQLAKDDMNNDLTLVVDDSGNPIVVQVLVANGANGGLGAHVEVTLPAGFDNGIDIQAHNGSIDANLSGGSPTATTVNSNNGGVDVVGAGGTLSIDVNNGSTSIAVQSWSAVDGHVTLGNSDLTFVVAAGLSGNITAVAGSNAAVLGPSPLPSDWQEAGSGNSRSFSFGADPGSMGTVALTNDFAYGEIAIQVQ